MTVVTTTTEPPTDDGDELVVLLDDEGAPCGQAPKALVHHAQTPLHLAFSCWLLDGDGRTLLTRRALSKRTWPGAWTNSFCGHPAPGEPMTDAVLRRAPQELGSAVARPVLALPDFRYRAVMADGTVENEVCPVFTSRLLGPLALDPAEVCDAQWVPLASLGALVAASPHRYSPWLRGQLPAMLGVVASHG